jgi:hypothetical protein
VTRSHSAVAILALCSAVHLHAQGPSVSLGARVSTLGLGGETALGLTDRVEVRGAGNVFSLDRDWTWSDVSYTSELKLRTGGVLLDLYPAGPIRFTAGGLWNGNELSGTASPTLAVAMGDTTYQASDIGTLTAVIDFKKFAPYLGIGLGGRGRIGFFFDVGIVLQGSPNLTYTATTTLTGAAATRFNQHVADEVANIEDDISWFKYYPVVGLGLRVKLK